jgi:hypothetical protein
MALGIECWGEFLQQLEAAQEEVRLMLPALFTLTGMSSCVCDIRQCWEDIICFGGDFELPALRDPLSGGISRKGTMENSARKGTSDTRGDHDHERQWSIHAAAFSPAPEHEDQLNGESTC